MAAPLSNFACYNATLSSSNKIWMGDDVLAKRVPLLSLQIAYNIVASRFIYHILRPLHVPAIIAQILAGFFMGSSGLGRYESVFNIMYRQEGILAVETFANLGIIYYVFLSGLEMNSETVLRSTKKSTSIAIAGIVIPMLLGVGFLTLQHKIQYVPRGLQELYKLESAKGYLFWCLTLSVTSFPVIARILAELKLLYTRLGKDALIAAMLIDAYGWVLFTMLVPYANSGGKPLLSVMSTLLFIIFCFCVLRPILTPIIELKTSKDNWNKSQVLDVLMGLFVCSYITDFFGTHPIVGAFVYGLILPNGKFADVVMEMSDDFVTGVVCPIYFAGFGMRFNVGLITEQPNSHLMMLIVLLLSIPKVLSSLIVTFFFGMPARDGVAIGLLLNTKGIMAVILLTIAWDKRMLDPLSFTVMMTAFLFMTVMVSPLINAIYKPKFRFMQSQLRTVQKLRFDAELRIVSCVHNTHQATSIARVLQAMNATRISPLHVSILHLVELTRHGTALLVSQIDNSSSGSVKAEHMYGSQAELENITNVFVELAQEYNAVRFDTSSAVSSYATIHEDIYNVAEEKRASLILLHFHKELTSEGALEITNNAHIDINRHVLQKAPCSVGIFVDRGVGSLLETKMNIIMIFIGGPDDREALSIAWRMAGHSGTKLHVVRIHLLGEVVEENEDEIEDNYGSGNMLCTVMDNVMEKELDEEYIFSFRHKAVNNNDSIVYSEKEVRTNTGEDIPLLLNEIDKPGYDLYIVGQGSGSKSPIFSRLLEWCENPELGVIGDIVASTSFGTHSSLLVVQQYMPGRKLKFKRPKQSSHKKGDHEML